MYLLNSIMWPSTNTKQQ